jgi:hypothetical protein
MATFVKTSSTKIQMTTEILGEEMVAEFRILEGMTIIIIPVFQTADCLVHPLRGRDYRRAEFRSHLSKKNTPRVLDQVLVATKMA